MLAVWGAGVVVVAAAGGGVEDDGGSGVEVAHTRVKSRQDSPRLGGLVGLLRTGDDADNNTVLRQYSSVAAAGMAGEGAHSEAGGGDCSNRGRTIKQHGW
jgi:hypothetical protein